MNRQEAYEILAMLIKLPREETHIGLFDEEKCIRAIMRVTVVRELGVKLVLWKER